MHFDLFYNIWSWKGQFRSLISPDISQESSGFKRSSLKEPSSKNAANPSEKFERASFRRKFGALLRGSAQLPAAINRGLQPIKRSLSFSKDLHRSHEPSRQPYRTNSVQWYNSLSSLAEDEVDADCKRAGVSEIFDGKVAQVTRTRSLMEKYPVRIFRYFFFLNREAWSIFINSLKGAETIRN